MNFSKPGGVLAGGAIAAMLTSGLVAVSSSAQASPAPNSAITMIAPSSQPSGRPSRQIARPAACVNRIRIRNFVIQGGRAGASARGGRPGRAGCAINASPGRLATLQATKVTPIPSSSGPR